MSNILRWVDYLIGWMIPRGSPQKPDTREHINTTPIHTPVLIPIHTLVPISIITPVPTPVPTPSSSPSNNPMTLILPAEEVLNNSEEGDEEGDEEEDEEEEDEKREPEKMNFINNMFLSMYENQITDDIQNHSWNNTLMEPQLYMILNKIRISQELSVKDIDHIYKMTKNDLIRIIILFNQKYKKNITNIRPVNAVVKY